MTACLTKNLQKFAYNNKRAFERQKKRRRFVEVTIYGDVIFLINFGMDFMILWITAVLEKNISYKRIFLGSLFLSLTYCIVLFFPVFSFFCHGIGGMLLFALGIEITFFPKTIKKFLQYLLIAYISAFAVGGVAVAFFFATGTGRIGNHLTFSVSPFPIKILIATSCFFYIFIKLGKDWLERNIIHQKAYCNVLLKQKEVQINLHMLIDTGNSLKDPFSGNDVAVAAFPAIKNLFSKETQLYFFKEYQNQQKFYEYVLQNEKTLPLHLIPFSSLGKENGLLLVFQPEKMEIEGSLKKNISLGIYCGSFSGGYDGLVSPEILT